MIYRKPEKLLSNKILMHYEINFLKSLLLTVSIETLVLLILNKTRVLINNQKISILLITGITASAATLPYFWFIFPLFIKTKLLYHLSSEISAVLLETFIILGFLRISYKKAFLVSLATNAVSYSLGLLIHWLFGILA